MADVYLVEDWERGGIECRLLKVEGQYVGCAKVPDDSGIELTGDYEDVGWAIDAGFIDAAVYPRSGWITSTLGGRDRDYPSDDDTAIERTNRLAELLARHVEMVRQQREGGR